MSRFASCSLGERRFAALVERDEALPLGHVEELGAATPSEVLADPPLTGERIPLADLTLRPVVPRPGKIICVGLNYRDHAEEQGVELPAAPLLFAKWPNALIGPGDPIVIPPIVSRCDYEAELGVVMGKRASRVTADNAMEHVLGLTCLIDVTARELQRKEIQYTRAKGFDTFAPIGPCIAVGLDPSALDVEGWLNGERKQASNTRQLIFTVPQIVAFISSVMTLLPGDVIATGTPSGVGPLKSGDTFMVNIAGIGELKNTVG